MGQLFENNIRFETAQYVHARHGFDLSQVQFDPPALEVEFSQFMENVARVEEELENLFLSETRTED